MRLISGDLESLTKTPSTVSPYAIAMDVTNGMLEIQGSDQKSKTNCRHCSNSNELLERVVVESEDTKAA